MVISVGIPCDRSLQERSIESASTPQSSIPLSLSHCVSTNMWHECSPKVPHFSDLRSRGPVSIMR